MSEINYAVIVIAVFFSIASPGPATLAVAGASMNHGRIHGSVLAFGIATGGIVWSISAAFGLSSIMYTNAWLFEVMRYLGACYLLYLAYKSGRSAISQKNTEIEGSRKRGLKSTYFKGMALQLSNPKAILFFASFYAVMIPADTAPKELVAVIATISIMSITVFQTYAYLFSISKVRDTYINLRRYFEAFFAVFFSFAGFKVLTSKLE